MNKSITWMRAVEQASFDDIAWITVCSLTACSLTACSLTACSLTACPLTVPSTTFGTCARTEYSNKRVDTNYFISLFDVIP